jgi:hypothetical protein
MNCWEYMKCGRERGGSKADELGVCPAYPDDGKNCAYIAGTICDGKTQGFFAHKMLNCMKCEFYKSEHFNKDYLKKKK